MKVIEPTVKVIGLSQNTGHILKSLSQWSYFKVIRSMFSVWKVKVIRSVTLTLTLTLTLSWFIQKLYYYNISAVTHRNLDDRDFRNFEIGTRTSLFIFNLRAACIATRYFLIDTRRGVHIIISDCGLVYATILAFFMTSCQPFSCVPMCADQYVIVKSTPVLRLGRIVDIGQFVHIVLSLSWNSDGLIQLYCVHFQGGGVKFEWQTFRTWDVQNLFFWDD